MYCTKLSNKIELVVIKAIFIRGKMKIFGVDKMAKIYLNAKTVKNEKLYKKEWINSAMALEWE